MDKPRYEIGYALTPKKRQSFLQPSLVELAKSRGIDLIPIDSTKPLVDQGPFDAILHKLSGENWNKQLEEYCQKHPHVTIVDRPEAIERLHNRISMLQAVAELKTSRENERFGTPMQIVVDKPEAFNDLEILASLKFPVIAKPLVADGTAISHSMSLVFNDQGLKSLKPPLVLQEFVNHGGVIFKVYVVGDFVKCVKRKSLPDVPVEKLQTSSEGSLSFCQISNMSSDNNESYDEVLELEKVELPPMRFIEELANGLREVLGLRLFNFDVIRDSKARNRYLVIDINYFPGYAKMPGYESILTDFFWNLFHEKPQDFEGGVALECNEGNKIDSGVLNIESKTNIADDNTGGMISTLSREEENDTNGRNSTVANEEMENEIYH